MTNPLGEGSSEFSNQDSIITTIGVDIPPGSIDGLREVSRLSSELQTILEMNARFTKDIFSYNKELPKIHEQVVTLQKQEIDNLRQQADLEERISNIRNSRIVQAGGSAHNNGIDPLGGPPIGGPLDPSAPPGSDPNNPGRSDSRGPARRGPTSPSSGPTSPGNRAPLGTTNAIIGNIEEASRADGIHGGLNSAGRLAGTLGSAIRNSPIPDESFLGGLGSSALKVAPWAIAAGVATGTINKLLTTGADITKQGNSAHGGGFGEGYGYEMSVRSQPVSTPILTPNGWEKMGSLKVGDQVISGDGTATTVLGVYDHGFREVYEILFEDGSSTRCTLDHLWAVYTRNHSEPRVMKFEDMIFGKRSNEFGLKRKNDVPRYRIPLVKPIQFAEKTFPIDPYTLGILLGDGSYSNRSVTLTCCEPQVYEMIVPEGVTIKRVNTKRGGNYGSYYFAGGKIGGQKPGVWGVTNPMVKAMTEIGLMGVSCKDKFIPDPYMWGSIQQRFSLLQGLIDTDGTISTTGRVKFFNSSTRLISDVVDLVRSLGGKTSVAEIAPKIGEINGASVISEVSYRVEIRLPSALGAPARLLRKASRYTGGSFESSTQPSTKQIISAKRVEDEECRCIYIDHENHLYVTNDYIVTHNSMALSPFINTEQARKIVMSGVNSGFQGKELDTVTDFMAENIKSMNMKVEDSVKALNLAVVQGGESIYGLSNDLGVLKGLAGKGPMTSQQLTNNAIQTMDTLYGAGVDKGAVSKYMKSAATFGNIEGTPLYQSNLGVKLTQAFSNSNFAMQVAQANGISPRDPREALANLANSGIAPHEAAWNFMKDWNDKQNPIKKGSEQDKKDPDARMRNFLWRFPTSLTGIDEITTRNMFTEMEKNTPLIEDANKQVESVMQTGSGEVIDQYEMKDGKNLVNSTQQSAGSHWAWWGMGSASDVESQTGFNSNLGVTGSRYRNKALEQLVGSVGSVQNVGVFDPKTGKKYKLNYDNKEMMDKISSGDLKLFKLASGIEDYNMAADANGSSKGYVELSDDQIKGSNFSNASTLADDLAANKFLDDTVSSGSYQGTGINISGKIDLTDRAAQIFSYTQNPAYINSAKQYYGDSPDTSGAYQSSSPTGTGSN